MLILSVKTDKIINRGESIARVLSYLPLLKEGDIVVVSSKVVGLCEGRCIAANQVRDRDALIRRESEKYVSRHSFARSAPLTIKNFALTVASGIDRFGEWYVLWPKDPMKSAERIYKLLRGKRGLNNFGVIIADSHSIPMRRGTVGYAIGFHGFSPLRSYRGKPDLFGRSKSMTVSNLADGLSAAAAVGMGEGGEMTPLAVIRGAKAVEFQSSPYRPKDKDLEFFVPPERDLFRPLLKNKIWKRGGGK